MCSEGVCFEGVLGGCVEGGYILPPRSGGILPGGGIHVAAVVAATSATPCALTLFIRGLRMEMRREGVRISIPWVMLGAPGGGWDSTMLPPLHSGGMLGASLLPPDLGGFHHTQHMTEFSLVYGCAPRVCLEGVL